MYKMVKLNIKLDFAYICVYFHSLKIVHICQFISIIVHYLNFIIVLINVILSTSIVFEQRFGENNILPLLKKSLCRLTNDIVIGNN